MLVVETVARVRRAYFVQEKSIKEIVRDLKVSRKTVRKVIRSGATSFHYARGTQPAPKLGPAPSCSRLASAVASYLVGSRPPCKGHRQRGWKACRVGAHELHPFGCRRGA